MNKFFGVVVVLIIASLVSACGTYGYGAGIRMQATNGYYGGGYGPGYGSGGYYGGVIKPRPTGGPTEVGKNGTVLYPYLDARNELLYSDCPMDAVPIDHFKQNGSFGNGYGSGYAKYFVPDEKRPGVVVEHRCSYRYPYARQVNPPRYYIY